MRTQQILAAGVIAAILFTPAASRASSDHRIERARAADSLHRRAIERLAEPTLDARRQAMSELEQASLLAPNDHRVWLDLGRLCLECGQRKRGRDCYEHARRAAPEEAEAYAALGAAWTWEWLSSFEGSALARAEQNLARAVKLDPGDAVNWSRLSSLALSRGRLDPALRAALNGIAADAAAWEPTVALACAAWRRGEPALADSMFRVARGRVPGPVREHFASAPWTVDDREGPRSDRLADPDLTTPENEAELDYLTRLGLALLLFRDAHGLRWDMRTELFVRYGPPGSVQIHQALSPTEFVYSRLSDAPNLMYAPEEMSYPVDIQIWSYPELGMRTELWDRSLNQTFDLPPATEDYADPRPNPMALAMRSDLIAFGDGRGVFRAMAPGTRPVPAQGQVARFPTAEGTLLLAHVVAAGEPTDSLRGAWAVVAADGRVVARSTRAMSASACDPAGGRVAEFSATVPPGEYRVDLSVSSPDGRHGLVRLGATAAPPVDSLDLSDVVMLCGSGEIAAGNDVVRIEPNLGRRLSGSEPLSVYFEIDHLSPGSDGRSRFAYTYSLHRIEHDDRPKRGAPAVYEASREETNDGPLRRQFITVPMRSIKRGTYGLRIVVRDLVAGTWAATQLRFERE